MWADNEVQLVGKRLTGCQAEMLRQLDGRKEGEIVDVCRARARDTLTWCERDNLA